MFIVDIKIRSKIYDKIEEKISRSLSTEEFKSMVDLYVGFTIANSLEESFDKINESIILLNETLKAQNKDKKVIKPVISATESTEDTEK